MKRILFFIAGAVIACGIFYSCTVTQSLQHVETNGYICANYENAAVNSMSKKDVLAIIRNYYQNQYRAIHTSSTAPASGQQLVSFPSTTTLTKDSRAVFFNLDTLKRLIYYIEKASQQYPASIKEKIGLNIYFASYPSAMQMTINEDDYTNRHTLVFIPSVMDTKSHIANDFDLSASLPGGISQLTPSYITEGFLNDSNITSIKGMAVLKQAGTQDADMNAQNHGTGTPPPVNNNNSILSATNH
jgi:hypothetical protein